MQRMAPTLGWFCSFSSVLVALLCATLALHGFLVGENAAIVEHSGPFGLTLHYDLVLLGTFFAIWGAPPIWIAVTAFRFSWDQVQSYLLQLLFFFLGWCLWFAASNLIEISPARRLF